MNNDLLLDTDIIVNVGRGETGAVAQVNTMLKAGSVYVSAVTEMELVVGCRNNCRRPYCSNCLGCRASSCQRQCKAFLYDKWFAVQARLKHS